ncbi:TIGR01777 family oxidoreductase [Desulfococcaceae bacterium HSG8]|nr:TIGR01777 family oxidoreductase [Desulfococcaceae bacterium HSG8]
MKIFITGGAGFVGRHLSARLLDKGHQVTATGSRPNQNVIHHKNFFYIPADTTQKGKWQESLEDTDAVINLAGRTIFSLWTKNYKKRIYDSRVLTTRNLTDALPEGKDITLCTASAAGYYGDRGDDILTEKEPDGDDFLARVCRDWETEAFRAGEKGGRVAAMRFGVVLGKGGGAMKQMIPAFRLFAGGPLGDGTQWFPWIHIDDLVTAILFVLENREISGPFNFTAPRPTRNRDMAKTLGKILKRPAVMPAPGFMIRLVMGEFGTSILYSQRAIPDRLSDYGFDFKYPDIETAIRNIVS